MQNPCNILIDIRNGTQSTFPSESLVHPTVMIRSIWKKKKILSIYERKFSLAYIHHNVHALGSMKKTQMTYTHLLMAMTFTTNVSSYLRCRRQTRLRTALATIDNILGSSFSLLCAFNLWRLSLYRSPLLLDRVYKCTLSLLKDYS